MDTHNAHSPIAWPRAAVAFLAFLALALGSLAPHDMASEQAGAGARVEIAESAIHPGDPAHFEDAEIRVHPGCVACLLQLGSRIVLGHPPVPLPLVRDTSLPTLVEAVPSADVSLSGPARAPPVSSPSA